MWLGSREVMFSKKKKKAGLRISLNALESQNAVIKSNCKNLL